MTSATERSVNPPVLSLQGLKCAVTMTRGWWSWAYLAAAVFTFDLLLSTWGTIVNFHDMPVRWMLETAIYGAMFASLFVVVPALAAIRSTMRLPVLELGAAVAGAGAMIASIWGDYAGVFENLADYMIFGPVASAISVFCIVRPLTALVSWIRRRPQSQSGPPALPDA